MSLPLVLNCVVHGDDSSRVFTIEIEGTKNVSALKELVKDKNKPFDHVPARALDIFKVSFPVDDSLDAKLKRFQPEDEGDHRLSNAVKRLKEVFGHPADEHLHVIVRPPPAGE
jgi:Crinkler effector protein N-terminal domain